LGIGLDKDKAFDDFLGEVDLEEGSPTHFLHMPDEFEWMI